MPRLTPVADTFRVPSARGRPEPANSAARLQPATNTTPDGAIRFQFLLELHAVSNEQPNTEPKALAINLDPRRYGTFAEIGAGQEVVRWFFRVGGAAGTIAKSMSAYD